ncbi:MAG: glycoside hydrolase family 16 protein [Clostridia bacterium]|nr:glycoside hydrolase family 16 protein [Clostridia bacterium]
MNTYGIEGHEPSILPSGKKFKLVWADEFDGTELDRTKWDYRLSMMQKMHPAWSDKGVRLDGEGNCVFTVIEDENGNPVSSQLQTGYNFMDQPLEKTAFYNDHLQWTVGKLREDKFTKKYGYFECRCRLQSKDGWWSAFWIQSPIIGASLDPEKTGIEIDIMECFKPGTIAGHNAFWGGYGLDRQYKRVGGKDVSREAWHTFGLLWDESGYTFYVDGEEDGRITEPVSKTPQFILISTEVQGYRREDHTPTKEARAAVGDTFLVDYVRVFDIIE